MLLHRTTSRFANFSSAGRQSTMNSSSRRVFRQCLRVRVGVIRAVSAAAVCTFVAGASAQACGARVGPGIASLPSPSESGVADGNAGPGPPSMLEACRLRLGCQLPARGRMLGGGREYGPCLWPGCRTRADASRGWRSRPLALASEPHGGHSGSGVGSVCRVQTGSPSLALKEDTR